VRLMPPAVRKALRQATKNPWRHGGDLLRRAPNQQRFVPRGKRTGWRASDDYNIVSSTTWQASG